MITVTIDRISDATHIAFDVYCGRLSFSIDTCQKFAKMQLQVHHKQQMLTNTTKMDRKLEDKQRSWSTLLFQSQLTNLSKHTPK